MKCPVVGAEGPLGRWQAWCATLQAGPDIPVSRPPGVASRVRKLSQLRVKSAEDEANTELEIQTQGKMYAVEI